MRILLPLSLLACDGATAPTLGGTTPATAPSDTNDPPATDTDVDPPSGDFSWVVQEANDDPGAGSDYDADRIGTRLFNAAATHPDVAKWWLGIAGTGTGGWLGEDCNGTLSENADFCHELGDANSEMCLYRVDDKASVVPGVSTWNAVDGAGVSGLRHTYVLIGLDASESTVACYVQGDDPSTYAELDCDPHMPESGLAPLALACDGPATPTPVTPPLPTPQPFDWTVDEVDGDGLPDLPLFADADRIEVVISGTSDNYPDIVNWEFGIAQTGFGPVNGWFGEDCDGVATQGSDICHLILDPDGSLSLDRVDQVNAIVSSSTTLLPVEFPDGPPLQHTYVLYGYDSNDTIVECFVQGHEVTYYSASGCTAL